MAHGAAWRGEARRGEARRGAATAATARELFCLKLWFTTLSQLKVETT